MRREEQGSPQGRLLRKALRLIEGDRNKVYGPPTEDFARTVGMLNLQGFSRWGKPLEPHDWAAIQITGKLGRLSNTPRHEDSVVDIGGYAGCYGACIDDDVTEK